MLLLVSVPLEPPWNVMLQEQNHEDESAWPLAAELFQQAHLPGGGDLLCVQQLLIKGLFQPDTLLLTVQVKVQKAQFPCPSVSRSISDY